MKIEGCIEVSGINRVVFYKKNQFIRLPNFKGGYIWCDEIRNRYLPDHIMMSIVKSMCKHPKRRVWTEGDSINIERRNKLTHNDVRKYLDVRMTCPQTMR